MTRTNVGSGKVVLIAGGGKVYTDIAARFCNSNKELDDILASPYNKNIVRNIIESGHLAATEFDNFIFGIEGYSRVAEVQLVRKRMASYIIKSGRDEKKGKRQMDVVLPESINDFTHVHQTTTGEVYIDSECKTPLRQILSSTKIKRGAMSNIISLLKGEEVSVYDEIPLYYPINSNDILDIIEGWYNEGVENSIPEEDLRYLKPQATEFKAIVSMNKHALHDWFKIRLCLNAQYEIRDMATKMLRLCKNAAPDLFRGDGPSCTVLGYCPENDRMNPKCVGKFYTKEEAIDILKNVKRGEYETPETPSEKVWDNDCKETKVFDSNDSIRPEVTFNAPPPITDSVTLKNAIKGDNIDK